MKTILTLVLVLTVPLALTACNTVAGVGEDISGTSRAVQRAVD